jgi:outer membrane protein
MRKVLFAVLVLVLGFQVNAFAAPQKIGAASMGILLRDSDAGKAVQTKLKAKFKDSTEEIKSKQEELKSLQAEIKKQALVLSLEARQDKELEYKTKVRNYQDLARVTQRKFQAAQDAMLKPISALLEKVVNKYAKDNGYSMIFDASAGFLFVDDSVNLTKKIMVEFNKAYKAGGVK